MDENSLADESDKPGRLQGKGDPFSAAWVRSVRMKVRFHLNRCQHEEADEVLLRYARDATNWAIKEAYQRLEGGQ